MILWRRVVKTQLGRGCVSRSGALSLRMSCSRSSHLSGAQRHGCARSDRPETHPDMAAPFLRTVAERLPFVNGDLQREVTVLARLQELQSTLLPFAAASLDPTIGRLQA